MASSEGKTTVQIDVDLMKKVKMEAIARNMKYSELLEVMVTEWLQKQEEKFPPGRD